MWKDDLLAFAARFEHPAWGVSHCRRVYGLALQLAGDRPVDNDALFAAAYLHDVGAFAPYRREGVDHAERSVQVAPEVLAAVGFPPDKVPLVQDIIRGHMYYATPSRQAEAVIFHDADVLDFMGAVGIARLLSIVGRDDWTPDLPSAAELIDRFRRELPAGLRTPEARRIGEVRQAEMVAFLTALATETEGLQVL